jgi:UDP-3-O-acyl N-acetylglucosamine deacetylase
MKRVLIVDDEPNIQKAVRAVLTDAGYEAVSCADPTRVEGLVGSEAFDLVLLDIWMPALDGHSVLKQIKAAKPSLPVIIMSGHASVSTGVETAKSGADDFLEKPFSSDVLLAKVQGVLEGFEEPSGPGTSRNPFRQFKRDTGLRQRTLMKSGVLKGKGLHTGENTGLILSPLPPSSGIVFEDMPSGMRVRALAQAVESTAYATILRIGAGQVACVEHLLSALHAYGVDNAAVKVNKEIPILDGSSAPLCAFLDELGLVEQEAPKRAVYFDRAVEVVDPKDPSRVIRAEPCDHLEIEYFLELPDDFGNQSVKVVFPTDPVARAAVYAREIAPARTFGFLDELKALQAGGLGQGGNLENFLLLDKGRLLNTSFRLDQELARHKILDIIGDLFLAGGEVRARITARKTGHRHNVALLRTLLGAA